MSNRPSETWQRAKAGVHDKVIQRAMQVARAQYELFDRFLKLSAIYDPYGWAATGSHLAMDRKLREAGGQVIENRIASNVDTITGNVATKEVRARFLTTGAPWGVQRRAKHLEFYAEEMDKALELDQHTQTAFTETALKGTAVVKVETNAYGEVEATQPVIDDVLVDDGSLQPDGWPLEMFQVHRIDRDSLSAQYPRSADPIRKATASTRVTSSIQRLWHRRLDDGRLERNQIGMLEAWYRPVGRPDRPGYRVGRHVKAVEGQTVLDEPWEENYFPFARILWMPRRGSWYGIGGAERILGHQKRLNKHNWQFDRMIDNIAVPTTYLRQQDANIQVQSRGPLGTTAVVRGDYPKTVIPNAISAEQYQRHAQILESADAEFGQSSMATRATKPAGIDSGVALREFRDQSSGRYASQEGGYEQLKLRAIWLGLMAAKRLGRKAPVYSRGTTWGPTQLAWGKVDPEETRIQMQAASKLSRTPAGQEQLVLEWAQAGVISQDEARRLMRQPDTERSLSLYTAAIELVERDLEAIKDGKVVSPTPFHNLRMVVWRGQAELSLVEQAQAPEKVLSAMQQYVLIGAHFLANMNGAAQTPEGQVASQSSPMEGSMLPGANVPMLQEGPPTSPMPAPSVAMPGMGQASALAS